MNQQQSFHALLSQGVSPIIATAITGFNGYAMVQAPSRPPHHTPGIVPPHMGGSPVPQNCPVPCPPQSPFPVDLPQLTPTGNGPPGFLAAGQTGECIPCVDDDVLAGLYLGDPEVRKLVMTSPISVDFERGVGKRALSTAVLIYTSLMARLQLGQIQPVVAGTTRTFTPALSAFFPSMGWLVRWSVKNEDAEGPVIGASTANAILLDGTAVDRNITFPLVGGVDPSLPRVVRGSFFLPYGKKYMFGSDYSQIHMAQNFNNPPAFRTLELTNVPATYTTTASELFIGNDDTTRVIGALRASGCAF